MSTRKFSRVSFNVDATIKTAERQFHGDVKDLSMSGMFMVTDERLQQGGPSISPLSSQASPRDRRQH